MWSERVAYLDAGFLSVGLGTGSRARGRGARHRHRRARRLGADGVTERELAIAKGNLRAETLLACEDSGARMSRIGAGMLLHGEVLTVDEVLARVEALTLDDVPRGRRRGRRAPHPLGGRSLRRVGLRRRALAWADGLVGRRPDAGGRTPAVAVG